MRALAVSSYLMQCLWQETWGIAGVLVSTTQDGTCASFLHGSPSDRQRNLQLPAVGITESEDE